MVMCVFCRKGSICPMHNKEVLFKSSNIRNKEEFLSVSPPSVFVGSKLKYPSVNIGIMSPPSRVEDGWVFDAQRYWARNNFRIENIVNLRSSLINSRTQTKVRDMENSFVQRFQEIGMAVKPVDVEIKLYNKIKGNISFNNIHLPHGPTAEIKFLKLESNVAIPGKIDKVNSDFDLMAVDAVNYLYNTGFDEQQISQVLSVGALGLKKNRKLVPTRLSITATDDILGRGLMEDIRDYKVINDAELHIGDYLGNYYFILLFPDVIGYELFESYAGKTWSGEVTTDFESYFGRTRYVKETAGGYYAARLPILEYLNKIKRQASILVLRFITDEYYAHLGVFVCRETSRKTIEQEGIKFTDNHDMINYSKKIIFERFGVDIQEILNRSKLLNIVMKQKKLNQFFTEV